MSDFVGIVAVLTLVGIQPTLYIFLKSVLIINISEKSIGKKIKRYPVVFGILGAHLIPFFAILGKQPLESITNFFSSLSYVVPSCSFNACSKKTIDYLLFPPDRFVDNVGPIGYWILIFAPVVLESIFWIIWFRPSKTSKGWELPLALIATSCLYVTTFLSLYLVDMYAPIFLLIVGFIVWFAYRMIKRFKGERP